jgi:hypothetical protein
LLIDAKQIRGLKAVGALGTLDLGEANATRAGLQ